MNASRLKQWGAAAAGLFFFTALWLYGSKLFIPALVEAAYYGKAPAFLNNVISGQSEHPVQYYIQLGLGQSYGFAVFVIFSAACIYIILKNRPLTLQHLAGTATPRDLAWIRIVVCAAMAAVVVYEDTPSLARLPAALRSSEMGLMQFFYFPPFHFREIAESAALLQILKWSAVGFLMAGIIGFKTKFVLPAAYICCFVLGGIHREFTHFFHMGLLPMNLLLLLCFLPCEKAIAVEKSFTSKSKDDGCQAGYYFGYARYACWCAYSLTYLSAGLSKIRNGGLNWWNAQNLKQYIFADHLNLIEFNFDITGMLASLPDVFFQFFGLVGCYGEIIVVLILFSARARTVIPFVVAGLHLGILATQKLLFIDLLILPLMFLSYEKVFKHAEKFRMLPLRSQAP